MQVSVIMTCFNEAQFISAAVDSVQRQTAYEHVGEIIIVDDNSTDNSGAILLRLSACIPKLMVIRNAANSGPSASRNTAIAASICPLLAFLDGDDIWVENKLELQLAAYQINLDAGIIYSDFFDFASDDLSDAQAVRVRRFRSGPGAVLSEYYVEDGPIYPSTILMPRHVFETVGPFDEAMRVCEDTELCMRVAAQFRFEHVPQPLVYKRRHQANLTRRLLPLVGVFEDLTTRFAIRFPELAGCRRRRLARRYAKVGHDCVANGFALQGLRYLVKALRHDPRHGRIYIYLILAIIPSPLRARVTIALKRWHHGNLGGRTGDGVSAAGYRASLESRAACLELLRCPRTGLPLRQVDAQTLVAAAGDPARQHRYAMVDDLPVLVDFENSVLDERQMLTSAGASPIWRSSYRGLARLAKRLVSPPNPRTTHNLQRFVALLKQATKRPLVVVVGGGTISRDARPLYDDPAIRLISFDIYGSSNVQFLADAHRIPLPAASCDGLVIQAVLEHVLQPDQVVAEIFRVLKLQGLIYAETAFMQHVHEGAYDFMRFTDSGHRYLFRWFELIDSGATAGSGTQLLWALDYFARGLFRSQAAGKLTKLLFFWLRYLDRLEPEAFALDSASGTYFLGRKSDQEIGPREAIAYYRGTQGKRQ
jgi:glycosyltransferase involved in cell wall biosynthesis/SAM-dependent methyltransferase